MRPNKPGMPPSVDDIFVPLRREISNLHGYWLVFKDLFQSRETPQAMKVTPGGFEIIRQVFRHDIIMAFSRITDPKTTGRGKNAKENLTLKQLLASVGQNCNDSAFLARLADIEKAIEEECAPFRDLRNRSVGHLDLETALGTHLIPLPDIDGERVQRCLGLLARLMNEILGHYTTKCFDFVLHVSPPAKNIVVGLTKFQEWMPVLSEIERKKLLGQQL